MPKTKFHNNASDLYGDVTITGSIGGAWQPGYLGNNEFIAISPIEFNLSGLTNTLRNQTFGVELGAMTIRGNSLHRPARLAIGGGENALCVIKIIPKGFKATGATVFGDDTSTWLAYQSTLSTGIVGADLVPVATDVESSAIFEVEVIGDGQRYVILKWLPFDINAALFGARIDITAI
tara:strand:- start:3842 stop:4375 length:534 start_codon:yes stop_codon:yes gene_type:complete